MGHSKTSKLFVEGRNYCPIPPHHLKKNLLTSRLSLKLEVMVLHGERCTHFNTLGFSQKEFSYKEARFKNKTTKEEWKNSRKPQAVLETVNKEQFISERNTPRIPWKQAK